LNPIRQTHSSAFPRAEQYFTALRNSLSGCSHRDREREFSQGTHNFKGSLFFGIQPLNLGFDTLPQTLGQVAQARRCRRLPGCRGQEWRRNRLRPRREITPCNLFSKRGKIANYWLMMVLIFTVATWRHIEERTHHVPELLPIRPQRDRVRSARKNRELPVWNRKLAKEI
jgi:hypothetical protein